MKRPPADQLSARAATDDLDRARDLLLMIPASLAAVQAMLAAEPGNRRAALDQIAAARDRLADVDDMLLAAAARIEAGSSKACSKVT